jgi:hypothetical protein
MRQRIVGDSESGRGMTGWRVTIGSDWQSDGDDPAQHLEALLECAIASGLCPDLQDCIPATGEMLPTQYLLLVRDRPRARAKLRRMAEALLTLLDTTDVVYADGDADRCGKFRALAAAPDWLLQINYLGKRGGFVQLLSPPASSEALAQGFIIVGGDSIQPFPVDGVIQQLDDCDTSLTFEKANIYSGKRIKLGRERILHHVVLPYRLVQSSKSYSYYERIE